MNQVSLSKVLSDSDYPLPPMKPDPAGPPPLLLSDVDVARHIVQVGCPRVRVEGADAY